MITNTTVSVIGLNTDVEEIENSGMNVQTMPNPFNEQLTLKYNLNKTSVVSIRIMNAVGQCVHTHVAGQQQYKGVYVEQLKLNQLPNGFYLLSVETDDNVVTKKIIKR